ncbi:pyridoxamine 5'-phosphate oxidase family protein [Poseidonibacter antarcticus]|uniref:pyridoxamine 5'-phosphate oxidase family protein n=1 Tax=Poseidonibacter antarcticus TaxID=2478538 RepID=UPI000EF43DE9|nr:pyridoxamine 5'-phosphate oxidase family protein [Poseidonibacter antarcticus]
MNTVFHEGEYHIQEIMGVRKSSDTLSSMIKDNIPPIASKFLKDLNFCIITISTKKDDLFTYTVYNHNNFIEIVNQSQISINLENHSYIPKEFYNIKNINIGMIGLNFEKAMRIRINGKGKIKSNKLYLSIDEIYSNCPKHIKRRVLQEDTKILENQTIQKGRKLNEEIINIISNIDTFFIATSHKEKGLDVSHKGGNKGFLKVLETNQLAFKDVPGNNLYNTIGNIYTNPNINIFFIDFKNYDTYHIKGIASIKEIQVENKKRLLITITCKEIIINKNSFNLIYSDDYL